MIGMEHYHNFLVALNNAIDETENEIDALETGDWDDYEHRDLFNHLSMLTRINNFFINNAERQVSFACLEDLRSYERVISELYNALDNQSKMVLPVDGGNPIGMSHEEWERLESTRYETRFAAYAWSAFADFVEYGTII